MNRAELVEAMAKQTGLTKKDADAALKAFIENVEKAVKKGDNVSLVGFGTFSQVKRAARQGVNPQTGAKVKIAATKAPKFKPGKAFKDAVAGKKK